MSAILAAEARRMLARRIVRFAAATVLLGMVIGGAVLFVRSHRLATSATAALDQQTRIQRQQEFEACVGNAGSPGIPPEAVPSGVTREEFCRQLAQESFQPEDPRFHLIHYRDVAQGLGALFIVLLAIIGASFAGAEWHAGTVATQLTWEPRRVRLLAAKTALAAVFGFLGFLAAEAILFAVVAPAGFFRGTAAGLNGSWVRETVGLILRAGMVAGLATAAAHALASLARNTAASVGAAFVYGAVLEPLLRQLRPGWRPWLLVDNIGTFVTGQAPFSPAQSRSTVGAAVLISAYTMALVLVALAVFRRRDVT